MDMNPFEPDEDACWDAYKKAALRKGNRLIYYFKLTNYIGEMAPIRFRFVRA